MNEKVLPTEVGDAHFSATKKAELVVRPVVFKTMVNLECIVFSTYLSISAFLLYNAKDFYVAVSF